MFINEDKIMAMEINGNLPDYAVRKQNYSSYAAQSMVEGGAAREIGRAHV